MSPRLPLGDLREASADPAQYRTKLLGPPRQRGGPTYFNALRDAIFRFHRLGENIAEVEDYLRERLSRFRDPSRRDDTVDQFWWYVEKYTEYTNLGWAMFRTRLNLDVSLPSWVPADLDCSGQIARADIAPSGFAGWIFLSGDTRGWRDDPRMPLIQEALAQEMDVMADEVIVGVYAFRERSVEQTSYSAAEIEAAHSSLEELLRRLRL